MAEGLSTKPDSLRRHDLKAEIRGFENLPEEEKPAAAQGFADQMDALTHSNIDAMLFRRDWGRLAPYLDGRQPEDPPETGDLLDENKNYVGSTSRSVLTRTPYDPSIEDATIVRGPRLSNELAATTTEPTESQYLTPAETADQLDSIEDAEVVTDDPLGEAESWSDEQGEEVTSGGIVIPTAEGAKPFKPAAIEQLEAFRAYGELAKYTGNIKSEEFAALLAKAAKERSDLTDMLNQQEFIEKLDRQIRTVKNGEEIADMLDVMNVATELANAHEGMSDEQFDVSKIELNRAIDQLENTGHHNLINVVIEKLSSSPSLETRMDGPAKPTAEDIEKERQDEEARLAEEKRLADEAEAIRLEAEEEAERLRVQKELDEEAARLAAAPTPPAHVGPIILPPEAPFDPVLGTPEKTEEADEDSDEENRKREAKLAEDRKRAEESYLARVAVIGETMRRSESILEALEADTSSVEKEDYQNVIRDIAIAIGRMEAYANSYGNNSGWAAKELRESGGLEDSTNESYLLLAKLLSYENAILSEDERIKLKKEDGKEVAIELGDDLIDFIAESKRNELEALGFSGSRFESLIKLYQSQSRVRQIGIAAAVGGGAALAAAGLAPTLATAVAAGAGAGIAAFKNIGIKYLADKGKLKTFTKVTEKSGDIVGKVLEGARSSISRLSLEVRYSKLGRLVKAAKTEEANQQYADLIKARFRSAEQAKRAEEIGQTIGAAATGAVIFGGAAFAAESAFNFVADSGTVVAEGNLASVDSSPEPIPTTEPIEMPEIPEAPDLDIPGSAEAQPGAEVPDLGITEAAEAEAEASAAAEDKAAIKEEGLASADESATQDVAAEEAVSTTETTEPSLSEFEASIREEIEANGGEFGANLIDSQEDLATQPEAEAPAEAALPQPGVEVGTNGSYEVTFGSAAEGHIDSNWGAAENIIIQDLNANGFQVDGFTQLELTDALKDQLGEAGRLPGESITITSDMIDEAYRTIGLNPDTGAPLELVNS